MKKIPKQEYTAEFRELAVQRVKEGTTPGAAAKELEMNHQTLGNWIKAEVAGKRNGASTKVVKPGADGVNPIA
jgi:transposase